GGRAGGGKRGAGGLAASGPGRQRAPPPIGFAKMERSGGEGAAAPSIASAEPGAPTRFQVFSLDGQGTAPAVLNPDAAEMLSGLRGRQFYLVVEAGGPVRDARVGGSKARSPRRSQPPAAPQNSSPPPSGSNLPFQTGAPH